jgi:hypothetical protein
MPPLPMQQEIQDVLSAIIE